ncbi:MAG TPA: AI-2E family transporter [Nitrosospira sp.]|nr:AI-2E family transporter [Nitrosospira sp.]
MSAAPEQLPAERLEGESKESSPDASTQALDEEAAAPRALPHFGTVIALWIIALVALIGALHLAQTFFVPLLFGILVSNALSPVVGWLERCRVPRVLGAGLVLVALIGGVSWVTLSLSDDAGFIVEKLPEAAHKLRHSLRTFRAEGPTVLEQVEKAAKELEKAAVDAGLKSPEAAVVITNQMEGGAWIKDFLLKQSTLLVSFAAQMPVVLLLTYFLLAAGTHFRRKLIKLVGPSLTRKKDAVRILEEVHLQVQRYLLVLIISNILIAVLTWWAFELYGLERAGVWGVAAGILRFVPYLGTMVILPASGIAGLLQFGSLPLALAIAATTVLISGSIGMLFGTWLQGRFAQVNEAVLFIVLLFFGWLWGIAGLLLGAPLLAVAKVVCDRIESLKPVGEMLGR